MLSRVLAVLGAVIALGVLPSSANAAGMLPWSDHFGSGDFIGWDWWGQDDPTYVGATVSTPTLESVPQWRSGYPYVGRFEPSATAENAKLYKWWSVDGASPADISGSYTASYYIPSSFRVDRSNPDLPNIMQWKEQYDGVGGAGQDPSWWVNLASARFALDYDRRWHWVGPRPSGTEDTPVLVLNHWDNDWLRDVAFMSAPLDQWFTIRADVYDGVRIDFYVDGTLFDSVPDSEYPVGTFHDGSERWIYGVGNYTSIPNTLYVGEASYQPFDEDPSGFEFVDHARDVANGTSVTTESPAGLTAGDTLLLAVSMSGDRSRTLVTPSGWRRLSLDLAPGRDATWAVFETTYDGDPPPRLTWGGTFAGVIWSIVAYRGADPTAPVDAYGSAVTNGATRTVSSPSITTTQDDDLLVWAGASLYGDFLRGVPATMTRRNELFADRAAGIAGAIAAQSGSLIYAEPAAASIIALRRRDYTP